MSKYKNTFRIESSRLKEWDYSNPWWYYVTINTKNHVEYFGKVVKDKMILNYLGVIVKNSWEQISAHFQNVELDYYIIMPNHVHGIIIINSNVETGHAPSLQRQSHSLPNVIGSFKSEVSKTIHENGFLNYAWQSRFYDRIIRNEKELYNIRKYIEQNPLKWQFEKVNPENIFDLP